MSRVYKILPDIDDDFHPALGFVMFIMAIIMITSFFSYRSLIQALAMIYTSYVGLTFKRKIQNYLNTKKSTFRPVMAPYSNSPSIQDSDDEGYEEDSDHENDNLDVKCDSPPKNSDELDEQWIDNLRKRKHDTL
jgi:hypothetical protein